MLASVYSYRVMVKSISSCCVHGRRVLSNPVTYIYIYIYMCLKLVGYILLELEISLLQIVIDSLIENIQRMCPTELDFAWPHTVLMTCDRSLL